MMSATAGSLPVLLAPYCHGLQQRDRGGTRRQQLFHRDCCEYGFRWQSFPHFHCAGGGLYCTVRLLLGTIPKEMSLVP